MDAALKISSFRIGGMTCANCQRRIEGALKSTVGVEDASVNFGTGATAVTYDSSVVSLREITAVIEKLDYRVLDNRGGAGEIIGTLVIILALYVLLQGLGIGVLGSAFPLAEAGMGYGMLFVIGLITSVHCVAMCGGINLSQCIPAGQGAALSAANPAGEGALPGGALSSAPSAAAPPTAKRRRELLLPAVLYNGGRIISYTTVGIIVGALGSVISVSGRFQGIVQLAAGTFMVIMGINMLGLFRGPLGAALRRIRLPGIFARKIGEQRAGRNPLLIGLLNGLMPCGPLQAMQLYALSTGSPLAGGISMFLFSAGTVPLMFGIGALSSVLSNRAGGPAFRRGVMRLGAILITVMGMTMFSYGLNLGGFSDRIGLGASQAAATINPFAAVKPERALPILIEDGVQIVNSTLSGGRYPAITVQQGVPVKWTINAPAGSINGCNNRMIIREYGIEYRFKPGENLIEFTPARTGRFSYSCWMGMIRSSITVVEEGQSLAEVEEPEEAGPVPAGVAIPTDRIALAEIAEDGSSQTVTVNLWDEGIDPAVLVIQRGIPAAWIINNDSLDPGNSRLIFPAYNTQIDMERGNNVIQLMPAEDFDFSTADNVFYGYVKVVEDLGKADMEAVRAEVSEFETLIYPESYFEAQAGGCCGQR
jgi:sulfite exporter TauE/SafE/copper chaperone CopZ